MSQSIFDFCIVYIPKFEVILNKARENVAVINKKVNSKSKKVDSQTYTSKNAIKSLAVDENQVHLFTKAITDSETVLLNIMEIVKRLKKTSKEDEDEHMLSTKSFIAQNQKLLSERLKVVRDQYIALTLMSLKRSQKIILFTVSNSLRIKSSIVAYGFVHAESDELSRPMLITIIKKACEMDVPINCSGSDGASNISIEGLFLKQPVFVGTIAKQISSQFIKSTADEVQKAFIELSVEFVKEDSAKNWKRSNTDDGTIHHTMEPSKLFNLQLPTVPLKNQVLEQPFLTKVFAEAYLKAARFGLNLEFVSSVQFIDLCKIKYRFECILSKAYEHRLIDEKNVDRCWIAHSGEILNADRVIACAVFETITQFYKGVGITGRRAFISQIAFDLQLCKHYSAGLDFYRVPYIPEINPYCSSANTTILSGDEKLLLCM